MVVFKYIEDKDVFQTFYSKQLAKRLIHGTSASEDLEGAMIGKLKVRSLSIFMRCSLMTWSSLRAATSTPRSCSACSRTCHCPATYSSGSRAILRALQRRIWAEVLLSLYNTELLCSLLLAVDFSILVLATGSWPLQPPTTNFSIPKELSPAEELFQKFYQTHHQGRKLNWLHQLSKGELKARVGTKIFTFQVSTYQMALLLQFNNYETPSYDELQVASQLSDPVLKTTLLVLLPLRLVHRH